MNDVTTESCKLDDIAAYLDGELTNAALERFEAHLSSCSACRAELRAQRQLLCALNIAFSDSRSFALPNNFSRVVAARAENDLSGIGHKRERRRALQLCLALAIVSFACMGAAARGIVFDPLESSIRIGRTLLEFAWATICEVSASAAVVTRMIGRGLFFPSNGVGLIASLGFLFSASILFFLIARYHRTQIIE